MASKRSSRVNRRAFIGTGLVLGAASLAACAPAAQPTATPAPAKPAAPAAPAAKPTAAAPQAAAPNTSAGGQTVRVLTADFFYEPMVLPATAVFNDANQGRGFIKVEKAPDGWNTKALQQVRDKQVIWSSYAVDSFFNLYQRIKVGLAAPLDDYIKASNIPWAKDFHEKYISKNVYESGVFEGKFYHMPTKLNMTMTCYNRTMVQGAGYEEPPGTWDEIRVMLKKIQDKYGKDDVTATSVNLDLWRTVGGIFATLTDKPFTAEGMPDIESKEWLDAMDLMKSFYTDGVANPKLLGTPDEMTTWQKGKMAIQFNYPSWLQIAQNAWGRETYGANNMPKASKDAKARTWMHVDGTYLIQNAPNPQLAVDWMLSILGPEGDAAETFTRGMITRSGSPMYKNHIESKLIKDNAAVPWLYKTYEMMPNSTAAPLSPFHFLVDAKGKKFLPPFLRGEVDAKTTISKMKEEIMAEKDKMLSAQG